MKQLRCEMCGSADIIKQDGVYVCQSCGMKYSVEEAKKMMIEGTVEVQGTVTIQNTAQVDNLLQLAKSSFDSKNYAQAEAFCNQVIAIDGANYDAWKIKGETIYFQSTLNNDRMPEAYNCIMTSYQMLGEGDKEAHRAEVLRSLRMCWEGDIRFVLDAFNKQRPGKAMLNLVRNTFGNNVGRIRTQYQELGYGEAETQQYVDYFYNYFIDRVNKACKATWENVVYPNYYRSGWEGDYRPTTAIMTQYINEGDNVIALLVYTEKCFVNSTPLAQKMECYRLQKMIHGNLYCARSFKRMEETTTNEYGAVIRRREYWAVDRVPEASAEQYRNRETQRISQRIDDVEREMAQSDPATKQKLLTQWQKERAVIDTAMKIEKEYWMRLILFPLLAIFALICLPGVAGIIIAVIFVGLEVYYVGKAISEAKKKQAANLEKAKHLDKKIREIS